jgi:hypothetical protein
MKKFQKFLEEVDIKGNPGVPGEPDKRPGEKKYLSEVEKRAKDRLGIRPEDRPMMTPMGPRPSRKEMELGREIGQMASQALSKSGGYERELSALATDVIYNMYKSLVDKYQIELDIKLVKPRDIKPFMDEAEPSKPPRMREITDPNVIKEIQKRKIANLVIQGEAKNTKHILHSDEVKSGLNEILGNRNGEEYFKILDKITKIADQLDWLADPEMRAKMMELHPDGMAGACRVDWKPKEKEEEEEEEEQEIDIDAILAKEDDEDDEDTEPVENEEGKTPILRARGVDFAMLLHESVKGLFEILSLSGLPVVKDEDDEVDKEKTKELLQRIYSNTGLGDEPQDWQYGPEIASDLRDFVNKNEKIDRLPNLREELWKHMLDRRTMPTDEFLLFMRGILANTDEARRKVDNLIDKLIKKIEDEKEAWDKYDRDMEEYNRQMEEYKQQMAEYEENKGELAGGEEGEEAEEDEIEKLIRQANQPQEEVSDEIDYSRMSKNQLNDELNAALDSEDYALATKISKFIKESIQYKRKRK